jgi:hypothetical protein
MKINFKKLEAQTSFLGKKTVFDIAEDFGNQMMYNGSVLLDIGFEDLAKTIYYSKSEVEIPERYIPALINVMQESQFVAAVKREVIKRLTEKQV